MQTLPRNRSMSATLGAPSGGASGGGALVTGLVTALMGHSALMGCAEPEVGPEEGVAPSEASCSYPDFGTSISLNATIPPLVWTTAHDETGQEARFDFIEVFCDNDSWSPFDVLAFVAVPSW